MDKEGHLNQWFQNLAGREKQWGIKTKPLMPRHYLSRSEVGAGYLWFFQSLSGDTHGLKTQM